MALELVPLTAAHCDEYLAFMDRAFADNPAWSGCYCAFYDDPCPTEQWNPAPSAGPEHRAFRQAHIRSGRAHGLLALDRGKIVGSCNAGPRAAFGNLRIFAAAVEDPAEPVGSIMCFVIDPGRRREGIATELLAGAERRFRELGLTHSEAYPRAVPPNPEFPVTAAYYKGSPAMYERGGYSLVRSYDRFNCVRKRL